MTPVTANLVSPPTNPPLPFANEIKKDDENDQFDEVKLLKLVPQHFHQKAKSLLSQFNERGNEITWDSNGILFIDEVSIPNSNMFVLFPNLLKKNNLKLIGATELIAKIKEMGLNDLIKTPSKKNAEVITYENRNNAETELQHDTEQWWYLGP